MRSQGVDLTLFHTVQLAHCTFHVAGPKAFIPSFRLKREEPCCHIDPSALRKNECFPQKCSLVQMKFDIKAAWLNFDECI